MYHFYDVVINDNTGVPLSGAIIRIYTMAGVLVPLFADEAGTTPIEAVSGIPDAAVTDGDGNYDFYIADGKYDMLFFQGDAVLKVLKNIQMVVAASDLDVQGKAEASALGVSGADTNLGTTPGTILSDNGTAKQWFQESEAAIEARPTFDELAADDGASLIGVLQSGADAVARTVDEEVLETIRPAQFGAVGDGTTDDRAALSKADTTGPFVINKNHRISSNLTITKPVRFVSLGRLTIDTGVTVTFSGGLEAPDRQIFYGAGAVAGLDRVNVAWFAGDLRGSTTDARTYLQKALDACTTGALVEWKGSYSSDGGAYIVASKAQNILGVGKTGAKLFWTTSACLGLNLTASEGAHVYGLRFEPSSINTIPASGTAVKVEAVNCVVECCHSTHCYIGVEWLNVNGGKDIGNNFNGASYSANYINNSQNIEVTNASGSAFTDWVDMSSTAGFIAGESVTFSGGLTGTWGYTTSATRAKIMINSALPAIGATITGATSGATATITAITPGHVGGGLRMYANAAGCNITGSAWAGGYFPGILDGPADAHGSRPEYGVISGCYFDFGITNGLRLWKCAGMRIVGCWVSSRANNGVYFKTAHSTTMSDCTLAHSYWNGILLEPGSPFTMITGCIISGNNRANDGKSGIYVIAGTTGFVIQGNTIGKGTASGFDGTQARPVIVEVGASDRYIIKNNLIQGNTTNSVQDGGTGVNKAVGENY